MLAIITAGLPNVEGWFENENGIEYLATKADNKLFKLSQVAGSYNGHSDSGNAGVKLQFNANGYNQVYGASSTVQPPALSLLPQFKF